MSLHLAGCAILDENGQIHLLHRNKKGITQWELPGGKVESGESSEQTAIREIHEELGVEVAIIKKLGHTTFEENAVKHSYTWFLAEVITGTVSICEPTTFDELRSFSIEELSALELSNNMKKFHEALCQKQIRLTK